MITVIAEHSVDLTLLPDKANILDLGCRGFLFTEELRRLGHKVTPVDIDDLHGSYFQVAITDFNGHVALKRNNDPQATKIDNGAVLEPNPIDLPTRSVPCYTLKKFSSGLEIDFWDLIKIDIEGSEYEVIMSLTEPPAKQLSIEFHLHTGVYGIQDVRKMEAKLHSLGYEFASHEMTSQHGMGMNYWDSLFILK